MLMVLSTVTSIWLETHCTSFFLNISKPLLNVSVTSRLHILTKILLPPVTRPPMKLYIAVLDTVPSHMVPVLVAHAVVTAHQTFEDRQMYQHWLLNSFKKVVLKVNAKEFNKILALPDISRSHENTVLQGSTSCAVVCPRAELPRVLQFAKLWTP